MCLRQLVCACIGCACVVVAFYTAAHLVINLPAVRQMTNMVDQLKKAE